MRYGKKVLKMAEYIEREALLREIERRERLMVGDKTISVDALKRFILNRPAADVAPVVHGRWLCVDTDTEQFFLCNRCKKKEYWESDYCPNCGCRMDG